jgi:hypothetical protein
MRLLTIALLGLLLNGCYEEEIYVADTEPPAVPRGVYSITGDEEVIVSWYANAENDLAGYRVYRGNSENGSYFHIATTGSVQFVDRDVTNGRTYYYAVTAYDRDGNESELSYDLVFDTPRPEGYGVRLFDFNISPSVAGYDFATFRPQHYQAPATDVYFEYHAASGGLFINIANLETDIQDMGYTESFDDIGYAPSDGWSPLGYVECIAGHTYVIWTDDDHYAKMRVNLVNTNYVEFDWAYQTDAGNPELKVHVLTDEKVERVQSREASE